MTRDEILNMPAGEQIDTLVAEKVMEWHKVLKGEKKDAWRDRWEDSEGHYMHPISRYDGYEDGEDFHTICWHPSESILWAWEVVEELRKKELNLTLVQSRQGNWYATFMDVAGIINDTPADTAELAICRAALIRILERESD